MFRSSFSTLKPSLFFRQVRHAEVVNTPASIFFGGHHNNWGKINRIANEASRVKIDYDSKYAFKLKLAAEKRGLSSVNELKKDLLSRKADTQPSPPFQQPIIRQAHPTSMPKAMSLVKKTDTKYGPSAPALDKIVKLDLLAKESKESIAKIWTQHYADKDGITAVIPVATYSIMYQVSQKYPLVSNHPLLCLDHIIDCISPAHQFILPMPRDTGLEFFFLQFQAHQCNITSLLEYKSKGEKARPFLTITHYPELADTKGIVLMRGEINDNPKRMISVANAQFLAFAVQQFYSINNPTSVKLVEMFNTLPEEFNYQDLIKEMEKIIPLQ
ncbi:ATP synthase mitochondrial F1 complex assembly factor 1 [Mucor ambiguus]|uniref:ATP synthase mitochondrial F1 complex assembly factor 1 n=1 Tax=Mucor ambiguus TaxID=91626 RepID=A0A0C9N1N8_9FUNG|nr:ATP synthase mitochondrial F1 complex assembly factor 1 [Mucor ambiguus]